MYYTQVIVQHSEGVKVTLNINRILSSVLQQKKYNDGHGVTIIPHKIPKGAMVIIKSYKRFITKVPHF